MCVCVCVCVCVCGTRRDTKPLFCANVFPELMYYVGSGFPGGTLRDDFFSTEVLSSLPGHYTIFKVICFFLLLIICNFQDWKVQ